MGNNYLPHLDQKSFLYDVIHEWLYCPATKRYNLPYQLTNPLDPFYWIIEGLQFRGISAYDMKDAIWNVLYGKTIVPLPEWETCDGK